ncbi:hypothetical protein RQP46_010488 [Phenoliferia psychrophenolica]
MADRPVGQELDRASDASHSSPPKSRLPAPGDLFETADSFFTACREGLEADIGISMHVGGKSGVTISSRCALARRSNIKCHFRICGVANAKGGGWVVSDERSIWTHDHDEKAEEEEEEVEESGPDTLQARSAELSAAFLDTISNKTTRELKRRWLVHYTSFCAKIRVPVYPINAFIVARQITEDGYLPEAPVRTSEQLRVATAEVWSGKVESVPLRSYDIITRLRTDAEGLKGTIKVEQANSSSANRDFHLVLETFRQYAKVQIPAPGDIFKSTAPFFTACREGLLNEKGHTVHQQSIGATTFTAACSEQKSCRCPFRIRAVLDSDDRWVVSDERSHWTHNHDAITDSTDPSDEEQTISDLSMLLATLSPLLGSHTIAQELHNLGIDSQLRFTNLVFAAEEIKEPGISERAWAEAYGPVVRFRYVLGENRLMMTDPAALTHVLVTHADNWPKPSETFGFVRKYLGQGLLFSDLRDLWIHLVEKDAVDAFAHKDSEKLPNRGNKAGSEGGVVIDVYKWMSKVTLDIIGAAGFGYDFNTLQDDTTPLGEALRAMSSSSIKLPSLFTLLFIFKVAWIFNYLPTPSRISSMEDGFKVIESESVKIVEAKKRDLADGAGSSGSVKDLLTLLIHSNTGDAKTRMSDAELRGQLPTFIIAGHETTSTALTWTLWTLARHPDVQDRLRKELRDARRKASEEGRTELESDELNSLKYLDAVCREILRVKSPVGNVLRRALHDDLIPLSQPIRGRSGNMISAIPVRAGQVILINTSAPNHNKEVFGEDTDLFRPERWLEGAIGEKVQGVGVFSQLMTFLAGILSVLVDQFEFAEREPGLQIRRHLSSRPLVRVVGEENELGFAMPLRVKVAKE